MIGALLNLWAADFNGGRWVYLGVLQRIALCYTAISLLFAYTPTWAIRVFAANCALVYASIMHSVQVPGCSGAASFSAACNAASYVDRTALGMGHVFSNGVLPEGLVSTLTAFVTTYIGFEFGLLLQTYKQKPETLAMVWFALSFAFAILGRLLGLWEPVIKKVWTLSFTFLAAAVSGLLMSACVAVADLSWDGVWSALPCASRLCRKAASPSAPPSSSKWLLLDAPILTAWIWLGRNPAVIFIGMVALEILLLDSIKVSCDTSEASCTGGKISAWALTFNKLFASWITNTAFASTVFALVHFALWTGIAAVLFRFRVFVTM
jgi:predicted acyltransferase